MSGLPPTSIRFFRGMPFEPPRAGISASTSRDTTNDSKRCSATDLLVTKLCSTLPMHLP